jgi:serine/threonine-protein phosphatase 6 regulatory ankyrin repeat subunit B
MKRILFFIVCLFLTSAAFADVNTPDANAQLLQAAEDGNFPAVESALLEGAQINAKPTGNNATALIAASVNSHTKIVKLLLKNGADVNMKGTYGIGFKGGCAYIYGITALMVASDTEIVKLLLKNGADVNVKSTDGLTALMAASGEGHTKIVKLLLKNGADVNVRTTIDKIEYTALKGAKENGHTDIVQLLEKAGAKE